MSEENKKDESYEKRIKSINMWDTFKMYSIIVDRYSEFCRAFAREYKTDALGRRTYEWTNPNLHDSFVRDTEPFIREMCGDWFGTNPRDARHPIMQRIMTMGENL